MKIVPYDGPYKEKLQNLFQGDFWKRTVAMGEENYIQFKYYDKWQETFKKFQAEPTDVWLVSFPKAGSTWCQELIWCLLHGIHSEKSKEFIIKRFPFFEWDSTASEHPNVEAKIEDGPASPGVSWLTLKMLKHPRAIKTHSHMELLPENLLTSGAKIVYVCRDPKDVCISYYYFSSKFHGFTGSFDDYFEIFTNDLTTFSPIWKHILDFWDRRSDENILFVRYEELKEDLPHMIRKIANFLEKDVTSEYVEEMADHLSFPKMKLNKAVNYEEIPSGKIKSSEIKFMRKGQVGDWKNHFNKDQTDFFRKWTNENLKNSDFPFYRDF